MKKLIKSLAQDFRRAGDGLQYAHMGEFLPQRGKDATVRQLDGAAVEMPEHVRTARRSGPVRQVVLAAQHTVRPEALKYALSACERLDAELTVLTPLPEDEVARALKAAHADAARWRVVATGKDLLRAVTAYADAHAGLLFVVTSAMDAMAAETTAEFLNRQWHAQVPWVMVTPAPA